MELKETIVMAMALCALACLAAPDGARHALDDAKIGLNCHPEYKGAAGTVAREGNGWRIHYDFSGGGHGLGMIVQPKEQIWARTIFFDAFHNEGHAIAVLMTDAAGQTFRKVALRVPGAWRKFACDTCSGWGFHWGGPNDGEVRFPIRMFEINVDRSKKGVPDPQDVGDVRIRNIAYEEIPSAERAEIVRQQAASSGVRYTITDFSPGDRFSAGPRAFYRSGDGGGRALADGRLEIDFAREPRVALCNEIPVWGLPEEFLLTVEAPAEAAGAELELGIRVGKQLVFNSFGQLRPPVPGRKRIYQTLSMPGLCNVFGWEEKKRAPGLARSKRVMQVVVKKGNAPAKRLEFRLVRLEAVVSGHAGVGIVAPPLLATPPAGLTPPRQLSVGYLNLKDAPRGKGEIHVTMRDWEGRELGTGRAPVPVTPSGARTQVSVELPDVPAGLNFISYDCVLFEDGRPVAGVPPGNVCWTRPLADGGSSELRPDLPWGMGVYIHRSADRYAYASGYATPTNAAALAQMEQRAALAQAAGIKWERMEIKPSQIAYAKGQYDFSCYDKMFEIAERHGLTCCGLLSHYWPVGYKPYTQACYDAYVETARRTAEHFRGCIRFWEVWNEPNADYWAGPKEDYAKMVDAVFRAIKSVDPEARVIACSTGGIDLKFIDMCIGKGMSFDDLSIHPYRKKVEERRFLDELASVTNRAHGNPSWPTEMGWPTGYDNSTCSERAQAGNYACAYLTAAGSGTIRAIFGYDFVDDGFNVLERENNFGIVRRDLTPKPAYRAVAKICRTFMKGTASLESAKLPGGEAWIFRMGGKSAVWTTRPARLAVRTDSPATVTNLMDEETGRGQTLSVVSVGQHAPAFFDVNVLSVSSDGVAADAPDSDLVEF